MTEKLTREAIHECEFFGHLWKRKEHVIAGYVLYRWAKEERK